LLHDDFYDQDGIAHQPDVDVECPEDFPAPKLAHVSRDPRLLLDFSMAHGDLAPEIIETFCAFPRDDVLAALSERFAETCNQERRSEVLWIGAAVLGEFGAEFVRSAWRELPHVDCLVSLAKASAACLPFREGFDRVVAAFAEIHDSRKRNWMFCLGFFHTPEALAWIEQNIFEPITEQWGYLAAESNIDWPRVERWFALGRPLSLVAIDTLAAIADPQSKALCEYGPRLDQPPTAERFREVLSGYVRRDPVPRVQKRTRVVLKHADRLCVDR
jgi:hypothetical protein